FFSEYQTTERFLLTFGEVLYVGDPIALVVADDLATGLAALELIEVDYNDLPAAVGIEEALASGAPTASEAYTSNQAFYSTKDVGDVDKVFSEADVVVDVRVDNQRLIPSAIEPRAVVAKYDEETSEYTLWSTTQMPHLLRGEVAPLLGVDDDKLRVIAPDVGGGFGAKANVYQEEVLAPIVAKALGRPIRWVASRQEDNTATVHGRAHVDYMSFAASKDGRIEGVKYKMFADVGARYTRMTPLIPPLAMWMSTGSYDVQTLRYEIIGVFTNTVTTEAYRGAGRPEAIHIVERTVDKLAQTLGLDATEVRRKNFIQPDQFPYDTPSGMRYDSGEYERALDKALDLVDYKALRERQEEQRKAGGPLMGIGVSTYIEICGFGPHEYANVTVEKDGSVTVLTGSSPHGQGHITTWSQLAADTLQVPIEKITVKHGDTGVVPDGVGTFGSRSAPVGGVAVFNNAKTVAEKAGKIAAHLLEAAAEDVVLEDGSFHVSGVPQRTISWDQVIETANAGSLPDDIDSDLSSEEVFTVGPQGETFPFGCHVCIVQIDPETGVLTIERYVTVDDCGPVINPMIVDGQVHGGTGQGVGTALYEEMPFSADGQPLAPTLADYLLPGATEIPDIRIDHMETP
ncbi:MAG: xanthine dehydrogenase family protein molybdopterin-binding subunit, partial [Lentisphaeria bacterium]|nr:xanthine dehydrogenase family protein molybdopterin-binding subunit [Lentisphaeria bacterium]